MRQALFPLADEQWPLMPRHLLLVRERRLNMKRVMDVLLWAYVIGIFAVMLAASLDDLGLLH